MTLYDWVILTVIIISVVGAGWATYKLKVGTTACTLPGQTRYDRAVKLWERMHHQKWRAK